MRGCLLTRRRPTRTLLLARRRLLTRRCLLTQVCCRPQTGGGPRRPAASAPSSTPSWGCPPCSPPPSTTTTPSSSAPPPTAAPPPLLLRVCSLEPCKGTLQAKRSAPGAMLKVRYRPSLELHSVSFRHYQSSKLYNCPQGGIQRHVQKPAYQQVLASVCIRVLYR